jgi:type IV secretory pathway TrbD component
VDKGERRANAIHQSLVRPVLLAGAERSLAISNWITAAALILGGGLHWYTIGAGAFLLSGGHWLLTQAAKFDPQLSRVYLRHIGYQDYYPARTSAWAPPARVRPSVPAAKEIRG